MITTDIILMYIKLVSTGIVFIHFELVLCSFFILKQKKNIDTNNKVGPVDFNGNHYLREFISHHMTLRPTCPTDNGEMNLQLLLNFVVAILLILLCKGSSASIFVGHAASVFPFLQLHWTIQ